MRVRGHLECDCVPVWKSSPQFGALIVHIAPYQTISQLVFVLVLEHIVELQLDPRLVRPLDAFPVNLQ